MLLNHTGFNHYVFMRPQKHETVLPHLFERRSPNGSDGLTYRTLAYTTTGYPVAEAPGRHQDLRAGAGHDLRCFYGVGTYGGGPTREGLRTIDEASARGEGLTYS